MELGLDPGIKVGGPIDREAASAAASSASLAAPDTISRAVTDGGFVGEDSGGDKDADPAGYISGGLFTVEPRRRDRRRGELGGERRSRHSLFFILRLAHADSRETIAQFNRERSQEPASIGTRYLTQLYWLVPPAAESCPLHLLPRQFLAVS